MIDVHHLELVSHHLCPYVQRAVITLTEKGVAHDRTYIDLADKPGWFAAISPLGKVPLLIVRNDDDEETVVFESAVILEFLEETRGSPLHPNDPLARARHRAWIEFGSAILNVIGRFYTAKDEAALTAEACKLGEMFQRVENELGAGPWFAGWVYLLDPNVFGSVEARRLHVQPSLFSVRLAVGTVSTPAPLWMFGRGVAS